MRHAKFDADETVARITNDFDEAMADLDRLEAAIREQLDALQPAQTTA